ncbi:MAG: integral rane sensor signal transduction histidine kinase [Acidimicrobiaceae bacterium]|jgi:signal transduction histidine kinase|nr:integral rane sensor signal transduction histidine kinase [Acidimicrobiaceae bacterium]
MSLGHADRAVGPGAPEQDAAIRSSDTRTRLAATPDASKSAGQPQVRSMHERLLRFQQRRIRSVVVDAPVSRTDKIRRAVLDAPELDVGLAVAGFAGLLVDPLLSRPAGHIGIADVVLSGVTALPLVARRRYPLAVLALVIAGDLGCLAVFRPKHAAVAIAMLAVYTVGLQGRRRSSLFVGAAMVPAVVTAAAILRRPRVDPVEVVTYLALLVAALVTGDARRGRLALARAAKEKVEQEREAMAQHRFDEQRLRLAHELHDSIAHALVAVNVRAGAAAHLRRNDPDESLEAFQEIKRTSADALAELRSTLKMLRAAPGEVPLRPPQSLDDLQELIDHLQGVGIAVALEFETIPGSLPAAIEHAGYRIIQEALTNVLRHSDAHAVVVRVSFLENALSLEVIDDGRTLPSPGAVAGHGLQGMSERATALGGHCEAGVATGGGWRVEARLPVVGDQR